LQGDVLERFDGGICDVIMVQVGEVMGKAL
jgi:hypothetical protein